MQMSFNPGAMSFNPSRPRQPNNFQEWLRWFGIYASVYLSQHPEAGAAIMTYILRIQQLANRKPPSYTWRSYDELFRRIRAQAGNTVPWHLIHPQILCDAQDHSEGQARANFRRASQQSRGDSRGPDRADRAGKPYVCFDFNDKDKRCVRVNCKYPHKCQKCLGNHPAYACKSGSNGSGPSGPPTGPKPPGKK